MAVVSVIVDGAKRARRLDRFLAECGTWGSRSRVQRLVTAGLVLVDGVLAESDTLVGPGQEIVIGDVPNEGLEQSVEAADIELAILHEDNRIIVINKQPGLVVHPAAGNRDGTLVSALLYHWKGAFRGLDPQRLGLVHRLDKDTSGAIVVAKDEAALAVLSQQFQARTVVKEYVAIVHGRIQPGEGTIEEPIGRHPVHRQRMAVRDGGRPAVTRYKVEAFDGSLSLVRLWPRTGRTHQIRVHLANLGHPIVGDPVYGRSRAHTAAIVSRQALHARSLRFRHPSSGVDVQYDAPIAADLTPLVHRLCPNLA